MSGKQRIIGRAGRWTAAVRWFQRFQRDRPPKLTSKEFAKWVSWSANERHREQFLRVDQLWQNLPRLAHGERPSEAELASDDYDGSVSVSEWLARRKDNTGRWPLRRFAGIFFAGIAGFFFK